MPLTRYRLDLYDTSVSTDLCIVRNTHSHCFPIQLGPLVCVFVPAIHIWLMQSTMMDKMKIKRQFSQLEKYNSSSGMCGRGWNQGSMLPASYMQCHVQSRGYQMSSEIRVCMRHAPSLPNFDENLLAAITIPASACRSLHIAPKALAHSTREYTLHKRRLPIASRTAIFTTRSPTSFPRCTVYHARQV